MYENNEYYSDDREYEPEDYYLEGGRELDFS